MSLVSILSLCVSLLSAAASPIVPEDALELFRHGMYDRAMTLFREDEDPLSQDYAVLCAVKLGLDGCGDLVAAVDTLHPRTILNSTIHYEYSLILFDEAKYREALHEFEKVDLRRLSATDRAEVLYKHGYCLYDAGLYDESAQFFTEVTRIPQSGYLGAARYALGCHAYRAERFSEAVDWFTLASGDSRFTELCDFYLLDSRFMLRDYDYVISRGEEIYPTLGDSRARHIARLISESWLVRGNPAKAKDFLLKESIPASGASDKDCFHAGSVLYATGDYKGAIDYFSRMQDKTDSIGQAALYHMGDSYIKTRNKVSALDAFKAAAALGFNDAVREDAFFNYAKLAFDLNGDPAPFNAYIDTYSTSRKGEVIYGYLAMTALASRDYEQAVEAYDKIEELTPEQKRNYIKANYLRAEQLEKSGSWHQAVKYLRYAAVYLDRKDPLNRLCRYYLGEALYRSGEYEEALETFGRLYNESALAGTLHGALIDYNIGYCHYMMGDWKAADKAFGRFVSSGEKTFRKDALVRRADCLFLQRDYQGAVDRYAEVMAEYPDRDDIYPRYRMGMALGFCGRFADKQKALSAVLGASPSSEWYADALLELGGTRALLSDTAGALEAYGLLRAQAPDSTYAARALLGTATVRCGLSDYDGALAAYKRVVAMVPGSDSADDARSGIKSVCSALGRPDQYTRFLDENGLSYTLSAEEREQMYFDSAEQTFLAGRYRDSKSLLSDYLARYPSGKFVAETCYYLGECCRVTSDREGACDWYSRSLSASSDGSFAEMALLSLASQKYELESYEDAWKSFSRLTDVARIRDNYETAVVGRMRTAYRTRRYDDAIACAEAARKFSGAGEDAVRETDYIRAMSYLSTSRRQEAFALLNDLRRYPSTPEGAEATYLVIRSQFDWGNFDSVRADVYDFATKCGDQSYWLAKAFLVLADSFVETGELEQARLTYQSLLDGYSPSGPDDDIIPAVTEKLSRL